MSEYVFGEVPGVQPGELFESREALREAGVHLPLQAGIHGKPDSGAPSIVVSGGYEDDDDQGDVIFYTGQGGRDTNSGRQTADQDWLRGNGGLRHSCLEGLPVRVIRGAGGDPNYSPATGYRYDGLYKVSDYWEEKGSAGFSICRFKLTRILPDLEDYAIQPTGATSDQEPRYAITQRRVRNTDVTQWVKDLYDHTCQICGEQIGTPAGPYAEGAHVVPVGKPHNGPDSRENVLCLCPTCHVKFDRGSLAVTETLEVTDLIQGDTTGTLTIKPNHPLDQAMLAKHREIHQRER